MSEWEVQDASGEVHYVSEDSNVDNIRLEAKEIADRLGATVYLVRSWERETRNPVYPTGANDY